MTVLEDPPEVVEELDAPPVVDAIEADAAEPPEPAPVDLIADDDAPPPISDLIRPVLAAALSTAAAGLVAGGIFGSWGARATGLVGAFAGAFWVLLALRSSRPAVLVSGFPIVALLTGAFSLVLRGESPGELPTLVGDAISAGRLFRPPVPYDPGWTPILLILTALIGFACAWIGTALDRGKIAVAIPIPLAALMAITQPDDQQFLAGLLGFLPILAALAVLFGGHSDRARGLSGEFEMKRMMRGLAAAVPLVGLLIALNNASFLFPEPVYDPTDQPQKPKAVPLSAAEDRVLFEVVTDSELTGPWRAGVLDIYDDGDGFWKTAPRQLEPMPAAGALSKIRAGDTQFDVSITTRDLGNSAVFPSVGGATRISFATGPPGDARYDPRTQLVRMEAGRVPPGVAYTLSVPGYATNEQLAKAKVPSDGFDEQLEVPDPPAVVRDLLVTAPDTPWGRLDLLRQKLLSNITASGAGAPIEITPERVGAMFEKNAKATPYEIVAAEALLARWAGVPGRIGYGFDGLNAEDKLFTVRPRNSAQWLEVNFEGFGWIPLVGAPQKAEADLETDPNARFNPTIEASDDVAVEIYLPFEIKDVSQLYQRLRSYLVRYLPVLALLVLSFFVWPYFSKWYRRSKRRKWAAGLGPRWQIGVEYAELRDLATDLNVADIYSTPLEYLFEVIDDDEHAEFSWLVARTLYGDMAQSATDDDALAAERLGNSLRRRLLRGQPVQSQLAALFSRASLKQPYTPEVPNIRLVKLPRLPRLPLSAVAAPGQARHGGCAGATAPSAADPGTAAGMSAGRPSMVRRRDRRGDRGRHVASLFLVFGLLAVAACGGDSGGGAIEIGIKRVALNLVFAKEEFAKPVKPEVIIQVLPALPGVEVPSDLDRFQVPPGTAPPEPDFSLFPPCPEAGPGAAPLKPTTFAVLHPPAVGVYGRHNEGSIEVTGAIPLVFPFPPVTTWEIPETTQIDTTSATGAPVIHYEFDVHKVFTPGFKVVDSMRILPDRIELYKRTTINEGVETVFAPTPPINMYSFADEGSIWASAGIDSATNTSMAVNGKVEKREVVDTCGELVDTYQITLSETIVNLATGETSGTAQGEPNIYNVATQYGGMIVREDVHYTQTTTTADGTPVVLEFDYVSTLDDIEPKPAQQ